MQGNRRPTDDPGMAQRAIVQQVLRNDHRERWSRQQLERTLADITPEAISDAIVRLEASGVIHCLDEFIGASRCARHLDALGLIAV
jgi:hypothetical protein